jgi:hypothetical protein
MRCALRTPKTKTGWFFFVLYALLICLGLWPVIAAFNKPVLVLGLPLLMVWSYMLAFATVVVLLLADVMEVR